MIIYISYYIGEDTPFLKIMSENLSSDMKDRIIDQLKEYKGVIVKVTKSTICIHANRDTLFTFLEFITRYSMHKFINISLR